MKLATWLKEVYYQESSGIFCVVCFRSMYPVPTKVWAVSLCIVHGESDAWLFLVSLVFVHINSWYTSRASLYLRTREGDGATLILKSYIVDWLLLWKDTNLRTLVHCFCVLTLLGMFLATCKHLPNRSFSFPGRKATATSSQGISWRPGAGYVQITGSLTCSAIVQLQEGDLAMSISAAGQPVMRREAMSIDQLTQLDLEWPSECFKFAVPRPGDSVCYVHPHHVGSKICRQNMSRKKGKAGELQSYRHLHWAPEPFLHARDEMPTEHQQLALEHALHRREYAVRKLNWQSGSRHLERLTSPSYKFLLVQDAFFTFFMFLVRKSGSGWQS